MVGQHLIASRVVLWFRNLTRYEILLILIFLFSFPLINPWVRGDGVGYYAFARSLLIERRLDFSRDWLEANASFRIGRTDGSQIALTQYTPTGYLDNHFSIGPAILWLPFLITTHLAIKLIDSLGGHIAADGYSAPYLWAMAAGTAFYGFVALLISFRIARRYFSEESAFLAAVGVWFASSLPVYMYFNPSWSHALSAFVVAVFVWYWHRTRVGRTLWQWLVLGVLAGLMMDVYYVNGILLLFPVLESLVDYTKLHNAGVHKFHRILTRYLYFLAGAAVAFLPTLITKKIIYGSYFNLGYTEPWFWSSPALLRVAFSAEHGLFSWTPILMIAVVGLLLIPRDATLRVCSICVLGVFLYVIGCYADWHGISSFGNRFFVSLTILFVLGLGSFFDWLAQVWNKRDVRIVSFGATALFIVWNLGLIFQWGMHLIPTRGPISWSAAARNQVTVVPIEMLRDMKNYLGNRKRMMEVIEEKDVKQLKSSQSQGNE